MQKLWEPVTIPLEVFNFLQTELYITNYFYIQCLNPPPHVTNHPPKASYHKDTFHQTMRHEY